MTRQLRLLLSSSSSPPSPPADPPLDQVNSDFVVILAALLCALICFLGLAAVARCAWLRRISILSSTSASQTPHHISPTEANKGLKKQVLKSLPTQPYSSEFAETDCAICLAEFVDGDQIRVLPQCGHGFHVGCIDTWLGSHSSCPSCRQILVVGRCRKCGGGGVDSESRRKQNEQDSQITAATSSTPTADYLP